MSHKAQTQNDMCVVSIIVVFKDLEPHLTHPGYYVDVGLRYETKVRRTWISTSLLRKNMRETSTTIRYINVPSSWMPRSRTHSVRRILFRIPRKVAVHIDVNGVDPQVLFSEAVRSQQVKGCIQCNDRPATTGNLCPVCDRRSKDEPVLEELDPRGNAFKNCLSLLAQM
jgi:hypothetical protein